MEDRTQEVQEIIDCVTEDLFNIMSEHEERPIEEVMKILEKQVTDFLTELAIPHSDVEVKDIGEGRYNINFKVPEEYAYLLEPDEEDEYDSEDSRK